MSSPTFNSGIVTPPKFNSEFSPEKWVGKEDDPASYWVSVTFRGELLDFGRVYFLVH